MSSLTSPVVGHRPAGSIQARDESDPWRMTVELAQRARMTLDISTTDLEAAEHHHGSFHPTTWFFRNALNEARQAWERLRSEIGTKRLELALKEPPVAVITLGSAVVDETRIHECAVVLISIGGQTYRVQRIPGTKPAPIQYRLTRLRPPLENGPYFVCRLEDSSTQCDCADWVYQDNPTGRAAPCKHLKALMTLEWI